jgi:hypothetical protein
MSFVTIGRKIKFAKIKKVRSAPRWADIKKFGLKHARTRRISVSKKRWRSSRIKV